MEITIGNIALVGFIAWLFIILFILLVVLWIATLIYQGKRNQWVWFVLSLIFNPVWIIYWIVWVFNPKLKRKRK